MPLVRIFLLSESGAQAGNEFAITAGNTENHLITDLPTSGDALMVRNASGSGGSYKVTFS